MLSLRDLGSTYGTQLNGGKLAGTSSALKAGDIIGVSYGGASTPQLLLDYGFVPPQRLDGSAVADARLMARHTDYEFADDAAADRAAADAGGAAGLAARLRSLPV